MDKLKLKEALQHLVKRLEMPETEIKDCKVDIQWGKTVKNKMLIPDPKKRKVTISLDLEDK